MPNNTLYYLAVAVWSIMLCGALTVLYTELVGYFPSAAQIAALGFLSVVIIWLGDNT